MKTVHEALDISAKKLVDIALPAFNEANVVREIFAKEKDLSLKSLDIAERQSIIKLYENVKLYKKLFRKIDRRRLSVQVLTRKKKRFLLIKQRLFGLKYKLMRKLNRYKYHLREPKYKQNKFKRELSKTNKYYTVRKILNRNKRFK
jgi:hypothetical protein